MLICISGFWHAGHELSELCNSVLEDSLSPIWSGEAFAVLTQDLTSHLCVDLLFVSPLVLVFVFGFRSRKQWALPLGMVSGLLAICTTALLARLSSPLFISNDPVLANLPQITLIGAATLFPWAIAWRLSKMAVPTLEKNRGYRAGRSGKQTSRIVKFSDHQV